MHLPHAGTRCVPLVSLEGRRPCAPQYGSLFAPAVPPLIAVIRPAPSKPECLAAGGQVFNHVYLTALNAGSGGGLKRKGVKKQQERNMSSVTSESVSVRLSSLASPADGRGGRSHVLHDDRKFKSIELPASQGKHRQLVHPTTEQPKVSNSTSSSRSCTGCSSNQNGRIVPDPTIFG